MRACEPVRIYTPRLNCLICASAELIRFNLAAQPQVLSFTLFFFYSVTASFRPLSTFPFLSLRPSSYLLSLHQPPPPFFFLTSVLPCEGVAEFSIICFSQHSRPPNQTHYALARFDFLFFLNSCLQHFRCILKGIWT